jgi:signal transduction histidine kinase
VDRQERVLRVLPYPLLALPLLLYALTEHPSASAFELTAGLAGLAAVWHACISSLRPDRERSPWLARAYVAGLVVFAAFLAIRSPWFGLFAYLCFFYVARYLAGAWRWGTFAVASVILAIAQIGGLHPLSTGRTVNWIVVACLDVALTGTVAVLYQRSVERRQLNAELAAANESRAGMAAENAGLQAQLLTQAREAGVLEERQRLAREIHDTLAQGLTGIVTQLEAAQRTGDAAEHERRIGNAKVLARDSLAEARRSVEALRPQALENARLPEALAAEAARWSATSGVAADVMTTGNARPLHPEVEVALLRVGQEALANVGKHASASRVAVTLSYMEDEVRLDVLDDGDGFVANAGEPVTRAEGGFGLIAMRQRVERLAGQLDIESEAGRGTAVSASVPAIPLGGTP